jgi:hypothetical protein
MIPCELVNGKKFIKKILHHEDAGDIHFQEFVNDLQHQKNIKAIARMRVLSVLCR